MVLWTGHIREKSDCLQRVFSSVMAAYTDPLLTRLDRFTRRISSDGSGQRLESENRSTSTTVYLLRGSSADAGEIRAPDRNMFHGTVS